MYRVRVRPRLQRGCGEDAMECMELSARSARSSPSRKTTPEHFYVGTPPYAREAIPHSWCGVGVTTPPAAVRPQWYGYEKEDGAPPPSGGRAQKLWESPIVTWLAKAPTPQRQRTPSTAATGNIVQQSPTPPPSPWAPLPVEVAEAVPSMEKDEREVKEEEAESAPSALAMSAARLVAAPGTGWRRGGRLRDVLQEERPRAERPEPRQALRPASPLHVGAKSVVSVSDVLDAADSTSAARARKVAFRVPLTEEPPAELATLVSVPKASRSKARGLNVNSVERRAAWQGSRQRPRTPFGCHDGRFAYIVADTAGGASPRAASCTPVHAPRIWRPRRRIPDIEAPSAAPPTDKVVLPRRFRRTVPSLSVPSLG